MNSVTSCPILRVCYSIDRSIKEMNNGWNQYSTLVMAEAGPALIVDGERQILFSLELENDVLYIFRPIVDGQK